MAMKQVVAFVGAGRKGYTYEATRVFLDRLEASGDVRTELVRLSDYHLEPCRGCKACFSKGLADAYFARSIASKAARRVRTSPGG